MSVSARTPEQQAKRREKRRRYRQRRSTRNSAPALAKRSAQEDQQAREALDRETSLDWSHSCDVCGQAPVVPITGLCGPCTFGEADTAGGNW